VIPASFDYVRADSVDAALAALTEHGDEAKLLAGGHSLLPLMKLRLAAPSVLVDVGRLDDLRYINDAGDHIAIGALTRHRDLEISTMLAADAPLLAHAAGHVGDPQVRHRGTLGGSLAHAGFLESALAPDELLTEIRVPKLDTQGWSFQKFNRRAQDWAIVGVATVRANGSTGVALVNMGSTPLLASAVMDAVKSGANAADAAAFANEGTEAQSDINASSEYREHLARVLVRRSLEESGLA